ncbi:MAG: hypothetical protein H7Y10_03380 [Flavobacterium sp.]|nr:hypothetical protein [Flavobacterium sp.]
METIEKYQKLKAKYQKLKAKHKAVLKNFDEEVKYIMELEDEIEDINTKTLNNLIKNNKRFNSN